MDLVLAILIGGLYASGFYLLMRRSVGQIVIGLVLLGHAANLLIFTLGGLSRAIPPIVPEGATTPPPGYANPLPQALILTAIVIGFGVIAFTLVLIHRVTDSVGSDDTDTMMTTDRQ